jgi:hypothetical protein
MGAVLELQLNGDNGEVLITKIGSVEMIAEMLCTAMIEDSNITDSVTLAIDMYNSDCEDE